MQASLTKFIQNPWVLWLFKVVRDSAVTFMGTNSFAPTKAWAVGCGTAVLSGILHAGEAYLTQTQSNGGNPPSVPPAVKTGMLIFGMLLLSSAASAQTSEQTGWGVNPEFSAPFMFGQDSTGTFVSVPSFGVGADIGWKDIVITNGEKAVKYSAGLVLNGNISQAQPSGPKSVLNGLLGAEFGYKGINLVAGNQILGDPLTGPNGSRWLFYVGYDVSALLGNFTLFN